MSFDLDSCLGSYIFKLNSLIPDDICRPISLSLLLNIIYINLLYCLHCGNFDMIRCKYCTGIWMAKKLLLSHCVNIRVVYVYITLILFQNVIRIAIFYLFVVDLIIHWNGLYCIWKQLLISDIKIVMYHANKSHQSTKTVLFVAWARA